MDERRFTPRVRAAAFSWYESDQHSAFGPIENLSAGGMFLRTTIDADVGSRGRFRLLLSAGTSVTGTARVAWRREERSVTSGVGLEFEKIDEGRDALDTFLGLHGEVDGGGQNH